MVSHSFRHTIIHFIGTNNHLLTNLKNSKFLQFNMYENYIYQIIFNFIKIDRVVIKNKANALSITHTLAGF